MRPPTPAPDAPPAGPPADADPARPASGPAWLAGPRRWWLVVAGLGVLALVAVAVLAWPSGEAPAGEWPPNVEVIPPDERRPLPAWRGEHVVADRGPVEVAAEPGRPLVLNFWASWCGPCRAEQRGLERASRALEAAGVRFIGVNVRDDRAAAAAYLDEFEVSYPSLYDQPGDFVQALGRDAPTAPPTTLIVDGQGRIAARVIGVLPGEDGDPAAQAAELARLVGAATGVAVGEGAAP